ncbi:MAG: hypothetical protein CMJ31_10630 [Phycisphaerae bacterium]|nr:hypothetical protein [Phycisphaerae bacterium]
MLQLRDIFKRFGDTIALDGVSVEIPGPGLVALLGPNGAGKSTLMRIATGALTPDNGEIRLFGRSDPAADPALRARIGHLAEHSMLYPEMQTERFLRFRAALFGLPRRTATARIGAVIEACELDEVRGRRVGKLSKGYRQRVGLAAAMLHDPGLLVLDEPTSGLDPEQITAFRRLVARLAEDRIVLLSSHVLGEVVAVAERFVVMRGGRVIHDGPLGAGAEDTPRALIVECSMKAGSDSDAARVSGRLVAIDAVESVEPIGPRSAGWLRLRVELEPGKGDASEAIARSLANDERVVRRLHAEATSAEDRLMDLLSRGGGGADG